MANLLTNEKKKVLADRHFNRKILVVLGLVTAWLLVGLIFNLSLWFNLEVQRKILTSNISSPSPTPTGSLVGEGFKRKIERLRHWRLDQAWSDSLEYLEAVRPEEIKISQIVGLKTDDGRIVRLALAGRAFGRQDLVKFVEQLKQDRFFRQVDLPVNYLLSSADNQFIINLELKPID